MKKKRIAGIVIAAAVLMGVAVFAAQQISDIARSSITASNLKIKVVMTEDKNGSEAAVSGTTEVSPGSEISRIAKVKNEGKETAWVRVKASLVTNGDSKPITDSRNITVDGGDSSWQLKDGYWYYSKPLAAGETSTAVFTKVNIGAAADPTEFEEFNLKVDAEGTQFKNNGSTVFEAAGWPGN